MDSVPKKDEKYYSQVFILFTLSKKKRCADILLINFLEISSYDSDGE